MTTKRVVKRETPMKAQRRVEPARRWPISAKTRPPIANLTLAEKKAVISNVVGQIQEIAVSPYFPSNCSKCIAALSVAKSAAQLAPELVPDAAAAAA